MAKFRLQFILAALIAICCFGPAKAAQYAQTFDALLTSQRAGGVTLAGGKAYFYVPGSLTLKAIYADRNKQTPLANPVTLSADGTAQVFGDGLYDVKITNSAGVQKFLWEDVKIQDPTGNINYLLSDYSSLSAAITAIGSTEGNLILDSNATVSDDLTAPLTLKITAVKGKLITISSGKTLTLNGPLEAGLQQVFTGSGSVVFGYGSITHAYSEWWGATTDQLSTGFDSGPAVRKAIASVGVKKLVFGPGTYNIGMTSSSGTTFLFPDTTTTQFGFAIGSNMIVEGSSAYQSYNNTLDSTHVRTKLKFTGANSTSVGVYLNSTNILLRQLEIEVDGVTAGAWGIKGRLSNSTIENCAIRADKGIQITYILDGVIERNHVYASAAGIKLDRGTTFSLSRNYVGGSSVAGTKGIQLGDPTTSTISGDNTVLSGTSSSNILEGWAYGHYMDAAHGVESGSFSVNSWVASSIVLSGNYYESILTNHLWSKDTNFTSFGAISNSPASAGYAYNITWDKVTFPYRYSKIYDKRFTTTDTGIFIGAVSGPESADAGFANALTIKPYNEGTPRVRLLSTGSTGFRKSEIELRDRSTDLGHIIRYNRDTQGTTIGTAATAVIPLTGTSTEGSAVAWFTPTYTGILHQVIATASLPAASSSMDGRIIIEDGGTGNINLIVYAGGQRFRIDGGAAF